MKIILLSSLLLGSLNLACFGQTYYVDYAGGADTNLGISTGAAWQHAPGMQTCTNTCNSTTLNAGDSVILKGGVTWPNASFMWTLNGGAAGNPIYYGVDKTWYTGAAWNRPILSPGGTAITNNVDTMFGVGANVTVDNFEITGFYWSTAPAVCGTNFSYGQCGFFNCGQRSGQTFENLYIHGWTHAGTNAATSNSVPMVFMFGGIAADVAHDNIIVGTDNPGDHSMTVFFNGPGLAYNNYIKTVSSAFIVSFSTSIHDNHIEDVGPAYCNTPFPANAGYCTHENGFEDNGDTGLVFYNNVVENISAGLAVWLAPNPSYTVTAYNNLIYSVHDNQVLDMAPPVYNAPQCPQGATGNDYCLAAGNYTLYNNTIQCGDDSTMYDTCQVNIGSIGSGSTPGNFNYQNNHFISATTSSSCYTGANAPASCNFPLTNIVQTLATANAQGYNSAQLFGFSPTASGNSTVSAGSNLVSVSTGPLFPMLNDSTIGVTTGTVNGVLVVVSPARTMMARPTVSAWDSGAYEYQPSASGVTGIFIGGTTIKGNGKIQ